MRFYNIVMTNAKTGASVLPSSLNGLPLSSLSPDGVTANPGALNIELDIPIAPYHSPDGNAFLRIWGLGLKDLGGAFNLNPTLGTNGQPTTNITINAGMSKGLPLATAAANQAGPIVVGSVLQAFGNWVGTEQTVDIVLAPQTGTNSLPLNYVLNWKKNTQLSDALRTCLQTAIPKAKLDINISSRLTQGHDEPTVHGTLDELNAVVFERSKNIIKDDTYLGVNISYDGITIKVGDGTATPAAKKIAFQDLIGQPTWIDANTIQAKFVMRSDLDLLDVVTLPPSLVTGSQGAMTNFSGNQASGNLTFSGDYLIQAIHHYGNFRQPDASSWNTTVDMIPKPKQTT